MAVGNWKETVKLSITLKERKRLLFFKGTNKTFFEQLFTEKG